MSGHVILVLGMHRSGTSLIAKSLECLGAELGERARWNGPDNPSGFWEDQDVLGINEALLKHFGSAWDEPANITFETLPTHFCRALQGFIEERLTDYPFWAVKEPRLCRLLPIWRRAFENVGCKVSAVHVVRHPMAVAKSLQKRNGFSIEKGLSLWLEYVKRAREDIDPAWRSVTVMYEAMMVLPIEQVLRMGEALDLQIDETRVPYFSLHHVDDTLWHNIDTEDNDLPLEVNLLWQQCRAEAVR